MKNLHLLSALAWFLPTLAASAQLSIAQAEKPATPVKPVESKAPASQPSGTTASPSAPSQGETNPADKQAKPGETVPEKSPPPPPAIKPPQIGEPQKIPATPALTPDKPKEPELDEETKRQIEAAKQKILKEKAERDEAERKAREEAQQKQEREKTFFGGIIANSQLYAGLNAGGMLSLNSIHATGFSFGGFLQYRAYEHYGLLVAVETGQVTSKNYKLKSQDYTLTLSDAGTLGFLAINPALQYTLPSWLPVEINIAAGLSIYSLKGGTYSFKTALGPYFGLNAFYQIFRSISFGISVDARLPSTDQITSENVVYVLDNGASFNVFSTRILIRYAFF